MTGEQGDTMSSIYNHNDQPFLEDEQGGSSPGAAARLLRQWYRLSAPEEAPENASFLAREQVRRGHIASLIILGTFLVAILLVPIILLAAPTSFLLPWTITSAGAGVLCCLLAIPLNRRGKVQLVGILLLVAVDVIVAGIVLSEREGLDPLFLSMFDLLVVSELIAASVLAPVSVFVVAFINILLIVLDMNLQPRSMMWMQMVLSQQLAYSLLARPIVLYLVVAVVAYLWVRSALNALQRADRAELIAELERRESEQKQQLEQEIDRILHVHVRVANGDLNARAPISEDHALWQIGIALNNLLARLKSSLQAEHNLQRVTAEISQLRVALSQWQQGQPLQWYPSRATLLNPLVTDLRRALITAPTRNVSSPLPTTGQPGFPAPSSRPGPFLQTNAGATNARPRGSQDTPLPDTSGFFTQQRPWPQISETPPYPTPDGQWNRPRTADERQY